MKKINHKDIEVGDFITVAPGANQFVPGIYIIVNLDGSSSSGYRIFTDREIYTSFFDRRTEIPIGCTSGLIFWRAE